MYPTSKSTPMKMHLCLLDEIVAKSKCKIGIVATTDQGNILFFVYSQTDKKNGVKQIKETSASK